MSKEERKIFFEQVLEHKLIDWSSDDDNLIDSSLLFEEIQRINNQRRNFGSLPNHYDAEILIMKLEKVA